MDENVTVEDLKNIISQIQLLAQKICRHQGFCFKFQTGDNETQEPHISRQCGTCGKILN